MSEKKLGLGRGLSALLEEIGGPAKPTPIPTSNNPAWTYLPTSSIFPNPDQPRRHFDPEAIAELAASLREHGMLQPVLVRQDTVNRFELIAGERRWRAAQAAGLHEMPVIIHRLDDGKVHEIALIENIQRADLNPIEEAQGYDRLIKKYGHSQSTVADVTGKSRSHVANLIRLLSLPDEVLADVREGRLSMGHARALVGRHDAAALAEQVIRGGLSVRQTEALVAAHIGRAATKPAPRVAKSAGGAKDPDTEALERALSESIGLKVAIEGSGESGRVVIDYGTLDQLDLVAQRLSGGRF